VTGVQTCALPIWTFLFGWQRVALGLLIVIIVVFFPGGVMAGLGRLMRALGFGKERAEAGA
jgi:branched-chain amino acid transport system permease protein